MFIQSAVLFYLCAHSYVNQVNGLGTQDNHLQFVDIGTNGVNYHYLPAGDEQESGPIAVSPAVQFGSSSFSSAYVSTNGYIFFRDDNIPESSSNPFSYFSSSNYIIAPFWDDIDTEQTGRVRYEVHGEDSRYSSASNQLMTQVGAYISDVVGSYGYVTYLLVVEWYRVPSFSSRYSIEPTNTFQALIATTSSGRSYAIFTYKCGELNWSSSRATVGFKGSGDFYRNHPLSRNSSTINPIACINEPNSLWSNVVYRIDGGAASCGAFEFGCTDGTCTTNHDRCDGFPDCNDGTDEIGCTRPHCFSYQFQCSSGHQCVSRSALCDGDNDCSDGSDEVNCSPSGGPGSSSPSTTTFVGIAVASVTVLGLMCVVIIAVVVRHHRQRSFRRTQFQRLTNPPDIQSVTPTTTPHYQPKPDEWYRTIEGHMVQGPPPAYDLQGGENPPVGEFPSHVEGVGFQLDVRPNTGTLTGAGVAGPSPPFTTTTDTTLASPTRIEIDEPMSTSDVSPLRVTPERHDSPPPSEDTPSADNEVGVALINEEGDPLEADSSEASVEEGNEDTPLIDS